MSQSGLTAEHGVAWPSNGISEVPFRVYTDRNNTPASRNACSKGPPGITCAWRSRSRKPGDYVATTVGETAVIVVRAATRRHQRVRQPLRPSRQPAVPGAPGQRSRNSTASITVGPMTSTGQLTGVAFEHGVQRQGGMPPEFHKEEHRLQRLRVAVLGGLVFGTFSDATPDLETWLGPDVTRGLLRVMNRTPHRARPQHAGDAEQLETLFREREGYLSRLASCICS